RIALETGDTGEARGHYDRAIPGLLRCGDLRCSGRAHAENALARHRLGDGDSVAGDLAEAWSYATRVDDTRAMAEALSVLALKFGDETSVQLAGVSAKLLRSDTAPLASRDDLAEHLEKLPLDAATRTRALEEGVSTDPGELFSRALDALPR
ncbi:MAG: hypothetical protein J5I28_08715, partial [Acidimicrobiales bacterium]|nr:hypothetical protein [Acidimicrobiales bacterium]